MGHGRPSVVALCIVLLIVAAAPAALGGDHDAPLEGPAPTPREVTYTIPADYDTFVQWWRTLEAQYPGYLEMWSPNQRYGLGQVPSSTAHPPYDLWIVRVTNESRGFARPEVFFAGNPHGDERAGPIGAYWFVHWWMRHALTDAWNTAYDDWLNWLLDNREVYFLVSMNPDGFDRIRRGDASGRDLNRETDHDGPEPGSGWPDVFTTVQGRTVVRFMEEHQVRVGMDFHGGIRAMLIPWGSTRATVRGTSPVTGVPWSYAPPDFYYFDVFGHRMGDYMGDYNGAFRTPFSASNVGTPPGIVGYVARGTYLNWGYGADTATNPAEAPFVRYGPYRGTGALWYTPEISSVKNPPESHYGGDVTIGFGIDVRRMLLAAIDIAQPYVRWHPTGTRDGATVQAGDFVTLAWQVNGSLVADATYVQWGADPDPVRNPMGSTILQQDFQGRYWGGTGWEGAANGTTQGHVWRTTLRVPTTVGTYYYVARAQVDQRYSQVLAPGTYGTDSYLRIVKERTMPGWSETIVGADGPEQMAYREWWDSPVLRIDVIPDTTPPDIQLRSPANGAVIRAGTPLDFHIVDGTFATATVSVDGAPPVLLPSPWDVDTTGWLDGLHAVRIAATDQGGLTTVRDFSFTLDSTPPSVTLVTPSAGSVLAEGSVIDFAVADTHLTAVTWTRGGPAAPLAAPYDLSTAGWPEGPVVVTVNATDLAGNLASASFDFAIDVGPPVVTLVAPGPNAVVRPGTTLDFAIADVSAVTATWDRGGGPQPLPAPYDVSTAGWPDGPVTVAIDARDAFDRTTTASFPFTIDGVNPILTLVSPADRAVVRPGTVIDLEASDANLAAVEWNAGFGTATLVPPFDVNTAGWADGTYAITARAVDAAGNVATLAFTITIDGTPPTVSRTDAGTLVAPGYRLAFAVSDANLGTVTWTRGGPEQPLAAPYRVDTTGWPDGDHTVVVRARDLAGNEATASGTVTVDGSPPAVTLLAPTGDAVARPGLRISFSVSDVHLDAVEVLVDGAASAFPPPYRLDTTGWPDGDYEVAVRATDAAGNVGIRTVRIGIDGSPPVLGIPTPEAAQVGRPVTVRVTATDAHGPSSVTLHWRVPGGAFAPIAMALESGTTYVADIPAPAEAGTLEAFVGAEDEVGNAAETPPITIPVAAAPPPPPGAAAVLAWMPILLAVLAVIAIAFVVLRRRRRRDSS